MMAAGTTVLFVSHSIDQVRKLCNKAIILEHGNLVAQGDSSTICDLYIKMNES